MTVGKTTASPMGKRPERRALQLVVLLGLVSLFADMTYEGARSLTGQYLGLLGASAAAVGTVSGLGELVGYALRLVFGYISDKTRRYWTITIIGYAVNLLAVPMLAFVGRWELAAMLIIMERLGKAIRTPARDAILSHATRRVGAGWGFGLHEAMDQLGAMLGPLAMAGALYLKNGYQNGFAYLSIPALLALGVLLVSRLLYPQPQDLEIGVPKVETAGLGSYFWLYMAAVSFIALGYADFPLIAFHFKQGLVIKEEWIPTLYAVAMGVDAVAALVFGRLFDRMGLPVMIAGVLMSLFFAPLVFLGGLVAAVAGMALWGVGMGAQESIMRAFLAETVPSERRGTAYGIFNTVYGVFWFVGSALMGLLYDVSLGYVVAFSVAMQAASVILLLFVRKNIKK